MLLSIILNEHRSHALILQFIKRAFSSGPGASTDAKVESSKPNPKPTETFMQYRHGDVMLELVDKLPGGAHRQVNHATLAFGEVTGHSHAIKQKSDVSLYDYGNFMCLDVQAGPVSLEHEEHATIELPKGLYRVWRQREYSPEEIRIIQD